MENPPKWEASISFFPPELLLTLLFLVSSLSE